MIFARIITKQQQPKPNIRVFDNKIIIFLKTFIGCLDVSNGLLQKGLRTSIVSLAENSRDIISEYFVANMPTSSIFTSYNANLTQTTSNHINLICFFLIIILKFK